MKTYFLEKQTTLINKGKAKSYYFLMVQEPDRVSEYAHPHPFYNLKEAQKFAKDFNIKIDCIRKYGSRKIVKF